MHRKKIRIKKYTKGKKKDQSLLSTTGILNLFVSSLCPDKCQGYAENGLLSSFQRFSGCTIRIISTCTHVPMIKGTLWVGFL